MSLLFSIWYGDSYWQLEFRHHLGHLEYRSFIKLFFDHYNCCDTLHASQLVREKYDSFPFFIPLKAGSAKGESTQPRRSTKHDHLRPMLIKQCSASFLYLLLPILSASPRLSARYSPQLIDGIILLQIEN